MRTFELLGHLAMIATLLFAGACTNRKPPKLIPRQPSNFIPETLIPTATVRFQDRDTTALTMLTKGKSLFLTGRPFGFSRWDVGANPENPHLTFAASDQIDQFTPIGSWVVDHLASGALAVLGPYAYLSGSAGLSVIRISDTHAPTEVERYPRPTKDGEIVQDEAFIYRAIVPHPTRSILYGFREQDFMYTIDASSAPRLNLVAKSAYSENGNVCCVDGATIFNGQLYVAMRSRLWVFDLDPAGGLGRPNDYDQLQAVNVVSTSRYVYVQHEPNAGNPGGARFPAGIYVFDGEGTNVLFLKVSPLVFTIYDDSELYSNEDDSQVKIYRIQWTNQR